MQVSALRDFVILRSGAWYAPAGGLAPECRAPLKNMNIVGYGLTGLCAASIVAAANSQSVSFLRERPKCHGFPRPIEGYFEIEKPLALFVANDLLPQALERVRGLRQRAAMIFTVPCIKSASEKPHFDWGNSPDCSRHVSRESLQSVLKNALTEYRGNFTLSSGRTSSVFYDTVPACCRFDVAIEFGNWIQADPSHYRCGLALAGCYLAAVAARCARCCPIFVDVRAARTGDGSESKEQKGFFTTASGPNVIIDDFVTTGESFLIAWKEAKQTARDIRFISAYSRGDFSKLSHFDIESIYTCGS